VATMNFTIILEEHTANNVISILEGAVLIKLAKQLIRSGFTILSRMKAMKSGHSLKKLYLIVTYSIRE